MRAIVPVCLLTISTVLLSSPLQAAPEHAWSYRFGGPSVNMSFDVAVDGSGNVVITGTFAGTMNFGGGPLTSTSSRDIFLAKFDPTGAHVWSQRFGAGGDDAGNAVNVDNAGNIIITGSFKGPISFGGASLAGQGGNDIYVAKFNGAGTHQWSRAYGSLRDDEGLDTIADASGNVIVTGFYGGTLNLGGGSVPVFGNRDLFILKLDGAGAYQWNKAMGGFNNDAGNGLAVDNANGVYVTGLFHTTVNFGGGPLTSAGVSDVFVAKYAADGTHQWSTRLGGPSADSGQGIAVDDVGNAVVTGMFNDAFVASYNAGGVQQWMQSFDGSDVVQSMDLALSPNGTIAITGNFRGTVNFGGGALASAGDYDIFLAVYEASGAHRWSQRFGNIGLDWGYGGAFDPFGNLVTTGQFIGSINFGGGMLVSAGLSDVYMAKFDDEVVSPDTTPPVITCPGNVQVEAAGSSGTPATNATIAAFLAGVSATDDIDPAPVIVHNAPAVFPLGVTTVTFHAEDATGNQSECSSTVSVVDTTPPQIAVDLDHDMLWPPNHKFVTVCADITVSDNGGGTPAFTLVSITSDEPADGKGDGHAAADIRGAEIGTADRCFDLRAERAGNGDGRVYEVVYEVRDASGNTALATAQVLVPHDMSDLIVGGSGSTSIRSVHPNPFNPQTTVDYSVLAGDRVQVTIYDARGQLVRRLVDQAMPAGDHSVVWTGRDDAGLTVGSGVYFVKLSVGAHAESRKIVLLK